MNEVSDKIKQVQLANQIQYVQRASNSIEHHLRNSVEIELLMQLEKDGLGDWTITRLLNTLQDMRRKGETEYFSALDNRMKILEPIIKNIIWQLPVKQSNKTDHDWIHPKAKYHAYIDNKRVCDGSEQDTGYFDNKIEEEELLKNKDVACKKCMKKLGIDYY